MQSFASGHLHRSASNSMLAGVCGGLAETLGADATLVRLAALLLFLPLSLVIVALYLLLALLLPQETP